MEELNLPKEEERPFYSLKAKLAVGMFSTAKWTVRPAHRAGRRIGRRGVRSCRAICRAGRQESQHAGRGAGPDKREKEPLGEIQKTVRREGRHAGHGTGPSGAEAGLPGVVPGPAGRKRARHRA